MSVSVSLSVISAPWSEFDDNTVIGWIGSSSNSLNSMRTSGILEGNCNDLVGFADVACFAAAGFLVSDNSEGAGEVAPFFSSCLWKVD